MTKFRSHALVLHALVLHALVMHALVRAHRAWVDNDHRALACVALLMLHWLLGLHAMCDKLTRRRLARNGKALPNELLLVGFPTLLHVLLLDLLLLLMHLLRLFLVQVAIGVPVRL